MKKLSLLSLLLLCALLAPQAAFAKNAEVMVLPTRVVMESSDRFTTVILKNTGQATGNFTMDLIDMEMKEDGNVTPIEEGQPAEFSAKPYIHVAPKSVTLKPGETQNVRLMLRKPENLEPGEYRAHLKVRVVNDNVNPDGTPVKENEAKIAVVTNLVLIVPVIVRQGDTKVSMTMETPKIVYGEKGDPSLEVYLAREGNRSSMGDMSILWTPPGSTEAKLVKEFPGISVYRPTKRRLVTIPLNDIPKDVNLKAGKLAVVYSAQKPDGGAKLAESTVELH
jgi:hypothetical protein